ncbi:hypothetical protein GCM10011391_27100 [Pullulanibacillus camelliae]|uniref:Uncharacterized protein n=1 Tax=Pullulanibacillus camelliae TaxID=1707096 RepID=A0A8J2YIY1_9BACL|nr:hypothetical protein [Pullulanibacillus camelliae]GGE46827.1 hypothetical protein GCM10011391_27100 [Pullulanibacillus camelliae]
MRGMVIRLFVLMILCLFLYKNRFKLLKLMMGIMIIRQLMAPFDNALVKRRGAFLFNTLLKKVVQTEA